MPNFKENVGGNFRKKKCKKDNVWAHFVSNFKFFFFSFISPYKYAGDWWVVGNNLVKNIIYENHFSNIFLSFEPYPLSWIRTMQTNTEKIFIRVVEFKKSSNELSTAK